MNVQMNCYRMLDVKKTALFEKEGFPSEMFLFGGKLEKGREGLPRINRFGFTVNRTFERANPTTLKNV